MTVGTFRTTRPPRLALLFPVPWPAPASAPGDSSAGVDAELPVFAAGSYGVDLGWGRGESAALRPPLLAAWLADVKLIDGKEP